MFSCFQPYDVRKECNEDLCYDFSNLENYLNYPQVREALGVGDHKLLSCSPLVYEATFMEWMKSKENRIPALLEDGIEVLVYAGDFDLVCNWLGNCLSPYFQQLGVILWRCCSVYPVILMHCICSFFKCKCNLRVSLSVEGCLSACVQSCITLDL